MITPLNNKPLLRKTAVTDHHEPLIVELHPAHLVIRTGRGEPVELPYLLLYRQGSRMRRRS